MFNRIGGGTLQVKTIVQDHQYQKGTNIITMEADVEIVSIKSAAVGGVYVLDGKYNIASEEATVTLLASDYQYDATCTGDRTMAYMIAGKKGQTYNLVIVQSVPERIAYVDRYGIK